MKITKRQLKRIIREERLRLLQEAEEFKPRYKGDTPAKQGSGGWIGDPKVNMDFQMNDPGDDDPDPENDMNLYVNLSDEQSQALDELQVALELCRASGVATADIMDTVQAGLGN